MEGYENIITMYANVQADVLVLSTQTSIPIHAFLKIPFQIQFPLAIVKTSIHLGRLSARFCKMSVRVYITAFIRHPYSEQLIYLT